MIGRQIAIGFGIAIVLPLLIFYGVRTFSPPPKYQDYVTNIPLKPDATTAERQADAEKMQAEQKALSEAKSRFALHLFYASALLGYLAVLTGGLMAVSPVGTGLIFGGIFSIIHGYWNYWDYIADWERFASLLLAAAILLFIAYRKIPKPSNGH
ncbi:hypothetical protein Bind_3565 [Beijerinckia indica subsp. indica ATCC 9039]|uniref:Transmembrane protein n=2 Tax=Beijerinckia TaxID=532 RepID=B2IG48_BEII9|nr:hypothetical protein Bind_3565 [Beijerinckia indica subsp. indica ATCC 9039]